MYGRISAVIAIFALAACANEPAGGRGPFDPAREAPPRVLSPVITAPDTPLTGIGSVTPGTGQQAAAPSTTEDFRAQIETALNQAEQRGTTPRATTAGNTASTAGYTAGTEGVDPAVAAQVGTGIDPNDQSINLALTPRELQEVQRAEAARRLEAARQARVEIAPEPIPQQDVNANVVRFARQTTHGVGTRVYRRDRLMSRAQSASVCRRFDSPDEAQRQFLANGGPQTDRYNLDPDGDGFACGFNPELYRQLQF